jgi:myosin heavy subunit
VTYNATGFVEKNVETLSNELRDLGSKSSQELSRKVYAYSPGATSTQRSSIRGVSVGSQFRNSLQALVADLDKTQPHYIRCIKPNVTKAANTFLSGEVLKQLQYSGMMEAIRIRSEGYALREEHESFYHRFRVLVGDSDMNGDETVDQLVKALSQRLGVTEVDWQIGHSKVFLRRQLADKLDRLSKLRVRVAARTIGRFSRHVVHRSCSTFLVCWVKFRLHMLKLNRLHREATKISSVVRCHNQRIMYVTVRRGFILLQAVQRQKAALLRVNRIRDPFFDVSFQDCMRLLQTEQRRLEDAVAAKDFKVAAEHELKM